MHKKQSSSYIKAKPKKPDFTYLTDLAYREEKAGFYEAAFSHSWILLEYKLKEMMWNHDKKWYPGLDPRIKPLKDFCHNNDVAKIVIYSENTLRKDVKGKHASAYSFLKENTLDRTVRDIRNAVVHEGMRIYEERYLVCKRLMREVETRLGLMKT